MNRHEPTEIEIHNNGEVTYVSKCGNCNQDIELAEYYDEDRGRFLAKNWAVVTRGLPGRTEGVTYARFNTECLPVLV